MFSRGLRILLIGSGMAGVVCAAPRESQALFHWFKKPCATACPPNACAPQVVSYVPQTCFRPQVVCTPVTTLVAQNSCSPCGGTQTVMRPVTTVVRTTQMVPYTTYRLVYSNPAPTQFVAPAATACGTPACGATAAPALASAPVAAPATGCCGAGRTVAAYPTFASRQVTNYASIYTAPNYAANRPYTTAPWTAQGVTTNGNYGTNAPVATTQQYVQAQPIQTQQYLQPQTIQSQQYLQPQQVQPQQYIQSQQYLQPQQSQPQIITQPQASQLAPQTTGAEKTFQEAAPNTNSTPSTNLQPEPDPLTNGASHERGPKLDNPQDREAWRHVPGQYAPVSLRSEPAAAESGGWRQSDR